MAKILVVDDHPQILRLLQHVLRTDAHEVLTAMNGNDALELVERETPSLVLLDLNMPGKNGLQVLTELKGNPLTGSIPVIMLTAQDDEAQVDNMRKRGADGFLPKPFHPTEVLELVRRCLAGASAAG